MDSKTEGRMNMIWRQSEVYDRVGSEMIGEMLGVRCEGEKCV